jgi:nitrogen permease regulator 3-like protein
MASTLLAILLVTTSAKGSSLVYRWPPSPVSSPRLNKARPTEDAFKPSQLDNPWRASHFTDATAEATPQIPERHSESDSEYHWQRLDAALDSMVLRSSTPSHPSSGVNSPNKDGGRCTENCDEYDHLFGYSAEFLASLLCPHRSMCHQKFELLVDDLAFIGHPVCAEEDGGWIFKPEKTKAGSRGRETRNAPSPLPDDHASVSPDRPPPSEKAVNKGWLHTFHFVMVLDIPDPSSSASGNVSKYFDIIYEQVAFTVTAVLFQEQVLSNFVESECEILGSLKESCISKGTYLLFSLQTIILTTYFRGAVFELRVSSFGGVIYRIRHESPLRGYQGI